MAQNKYPKCMLRLQQFHFNFDVSIVFVYIFFVLALNNPTLLILTLKPVFYISLSLSKGKILGALQGSA